MLGAGEHIVYIDVYMVVYIILLFCRLTKQQPKTGKLYRYDRNYKPMIEYGVCNQYVVKTENVALSTIHHRSFTIN